MYQWTVLLEWNAGMEYWNGLNCYKYLIQYRAEARLQSHGLDLCADCLLSNSRLDPGTIMASSNMGIILVAIAKHHCLLTGVAM